jgi:hypothetical protein
VLKRLKRSRTRPPGRMEMHFTYRKPYGLHWPCITSLISTRPSGIDRLHPLTACRLCLRSHFHWMLLPAAGRAADQRGAGDNSGKRSIPSASSAAAPSPKYPALRLEPLMGVVLQYQRRSVPHSPPHRTCWGSPASSGPSRRYAGGHEPGDDQPAASRRILVTASPGEALSPTHARAILAPGHS